MLSHVDYRIGWISALSLELQAAKAILEHIHPPLSQPQTDSNSYILGQIHTHNVVLACLPFGVYGTTSAATVLTNMTATFPNIDFALMVGIGGGAPTTADIRLGDVVVSKPSGSYGGVIQYDYGKVVSGRGFQQTGVLNQPPQVLLTSIAQLRAAQLTADSKPLTTSISAAFLRTPALERTFSRPADGCEDQLFNSAYRHVESSRDTCAHCDRDQVVPRHPRTSLEPEVHYGLIASGNQVMKDGEMRDTLASRFDILCFEMEAAGLMNQIPRLVIRGISDYSDSHKNKLWQPYAAMTAAAYGGLLLSVVPVAPGRTSETRNKKTMTTEEKACLRSLFLTDPAEDKNALKRRKGDRVPGTCDWILHTNEVETWLGVQETPEPARNSEILWLFGNPGTGKSTIAIAMAEDLPKQPYFTSDERILAYFFCDSRSEERRTVTAILRGLLYQVIRQCPETINYLFSRYEVQGNRIFTSFDVLWAILMETAQAAPSKIYFLIDAIDECEQESQSTLLAQIRQSFQTPDSQHKGIHFLITSRPYPEIGRYLGTFKHQNLALYPKMQARSPDVH